MATIDRSLERFAPRCEETADDYQVPQYAEVPSRHFRHAADLVEYLESHPREPHSIYWRNLNKGPAFVMAFFTTDGSVILGLSCPEDEAEAWMAELQDFAGRAPSLTLFEEPPPDSAAEFRVRADIP